MARRRGRKALYEVMSKTRPKPSYGKTVEQLRPQEPAKEARVTPKPDKAIPKGVARWWRKPKAVQLNAGRIEISIPYQLGIAVLLGFILVVSIAFRLGQRAAHSGAGTQGSAQEGRAERAEVGPGHTPELSESEGPVGEKIAADEPKGNHRIVIQTYRIRAHLEPVKLYFDQLGIKTEIRKIRDTYYLVTSNKYDNPNNDGTNGYRVMQKIVELGPKYQAPPGYETFAPNFFTDAYGMRFDD